MRPPARRELVVLSDAILGILSVKNQLTTAAVGRNKGRVIVWLLRALVLTDLLLVQPRS